MSAVGKGWHGKVMDGGFGEVYCFRKAGAWWEKLEDEGLIVAFVHSRCIWDCGGAFGGDGTVGGVGGEVGSGAGG